MSGAVKSGIIPTNKNTTVSVNLGNGGRWDNPGTDTTVKIGDTTASSAGGKESYAGIASLLPLAGTNGATKRQGRRGAAAITVFTMKLTKN